MIRRLVISSGGLESVEVCSFLKSVLDHGGEQFAQCLQLTDRAVVFWSCWVAFLVVHVDHHFFSSAEYRGVLFDDHVESVGHQLFRLLLFPPVHDFSAVDESFEFFLLFFASHGAVVTACCCASDAPFFVLLPLLLMLLLALLSVHLCCNARVRTRTPPTTGEEEGD